MKCKRATAILLILTLTLIMGLSEGQAQTGYDLELMSLTWNHSTISVLIIPEENAAWWQSSYLNATLRAISEWNNAIQTFALNYSDFAYLSNLRMTPTVAQTATPDYDVYLSWARTVNASSDAVGVTVNVYSSSGIMMNSTITLAVEGPLGYVSNEVSMQNVALHEFGHSLGLGHSNYSGDTMYPTVVDNQPVKGLSTLDLFGVSTTFQWLSNSPKSPYSPQQSSVTLPSNIEYLTLPISYANLPPQTTPPPAPQTPLAWGEALLHYITQFLLHPIILTCLLAVTIALIVTAIILARLNQRATRAVPQN